MRDPDLRRVAHGAELIPAGPDDRLVRYSFGQATNALHYPLWMTTDERVWASGPPAQVFRLFATVHETELVVVMAHWDPKGMGYLRLEEFAIPDVNDPTQADSHFWEQYVGSLHDLYRPRLLRHEEIEGYHPFLRRLRQYRERLPEVLAELRL